MKSKYQNSDEFFRFISEKAASIKPGSLDNGDRDCLRCLISVIMKLKFPEAETLEGISLRSCHGDPDNNELKRQKWILAQPKDRPGKGIFIRLYNTPLFDEFQDCEEYKLDGDTNNIHILKDGTIWSKKFSVIRAKKHIIAPNKCQWGVVSNIDKDNKQRSFSDAIQLLDFLCSSQGYDYLHWTP
jgi:hypothetical protein